MITDREKQQLVQVIRSAGAKLLDFWPGSIRSGAAGRNLAVEHKGDGSPVTNADLASNDIIVEALRSLFPDDGIVSEELPFDDGTRTKERVWIIDPLDGTRSFVDGLDDFSILISLCVRGVSNFGLMFFPARDELAVASAGGGAQLNDKLLRVSKSLELRPKSVYVRHILSDPADVIFDQRMDSGCALLALAKGEFDGLIIKLVSHREWDLAAPARVIEESGGKVTDEAGKEVRFYGGGMNCRYFAASNGLLHDRVLEIIHRQDGQQD